ncbi:hypothetical protein DL96DRAFT_1471482, partial [Flagelloscypha sp. PMI_526]
SVFSHDGEEPLDAFNLDALREIAEEHLSISCSLVKLTEGGDHRARVASSAFPGDKLRSEVATLRCIVAHTSVQIPEVYNWSADARNKVGAVYIIMQKATHETLISNVEQAHIPVEISETLLAITRKYFCFMLRSL